MSKIMKWKNCDCEIPVGKFDINNIPHDCRATWDLICSGNTTGVFQLENQLGQDWSRKLRPRNILELADLGALLRPGPLDSLQTLMYEKRKNGQEKISYIHPSLEPILKDTQGIMVFQEQALKIAVDLAGFDLIEADTLRKAIGKKSSKLMSEMKKKFTTKALKIGILNKKQAEEIFSWIESGQRYSFNKCVSGRTMFMRVRNNKIRYHDVASMYKIFHDTRFAEEIGSTSLRRKFRAQGHYGLGFSVDQSGAVVKNKIIDIQPAGVQWVYRITLQNDKYIDATLDHKFPTPKGIKTLRKLTIKDSLFVSKKYYEMRLADPIRIKTITKHETIETYDITMNGPNHNFLTDQGIVSCNSHAVSYAILGYETAYCKTHFPIEFYISYLTHSMYKGDTSEEIYRLVKDARMFDKDVLLPDITNGNIGFEKSKNNDNHIVYGLAHIKGVGESAVKKLRKKCPQTWYDFIKNTKNIHRNVAEALIKSGACDKYGKKRKTMIRELGVVFGSTSRDNNGDKVNIKGLTKKEYDTFIKRFKNNSDISEILNWMSEEPDIDQSVSSLKKLDILNILKKYYPDHELLKTLTKPQLIKLYGQCGDSIPGPNRNCSTKQRREILRNKAKELSSNEDFESYRIRAEAEKHFLGFPISCSAADDVESDNTTHTCMDFINAKNGSDVKMCVVIDNVKNIKTKTGKNPGKPMCFMTISDRTCCFDKVVVFPDVYKKVKHNCYNNTVVFISGKRLKDSLIVANIERAL